MTRPIQLALGLAALIALNVRQTFFMRRGQGRTFSFRRGHDSLAVFARFCDFLALADSVYGGQRERPNSTGVAPVPSSVRSPVIWTEKKSPPIGRPEQIGNTR
jgi:hypothetical protein